jgi:ribose 5-phosphate isomerase A
MTDLEFEKASAARRAVEEVSDGMLVGLGTGTTAAYAVKELARKVAMGLRVTATATSKATEALSSSLGIRLTPFDALTRVDLTIDGADDIDPFLRAIKGGGGALLREKVVATASDRMIVVVDSSKPVETLGRSKLPVEVLPFAAAFVAHELEGLGFAVVRRMKSDGKDFLTDQSAFIFDLTCGTIADPIGLAATLDVIPGLIGHGLFLDEIDTVMIGDGDQVRIRTRDFPGAQ